MSSVEFIYLNAKTIIQCNPEEKMKNIIKKFLVKCDEMENEIFFLYNGVTLNEELTFNETANNLDKKSNHMTIVVNEIENEKEKISTLKKSKFVICPECKENARLSIEDFKLKLYECRNGHEVHDMQLNEFEKTQYIDQSKIICDICKTRNKADSFENKFFICLSCKMNMCLLCQSNHDKSHAIIDYEKKYFMCAEHYDPYAYYCNNCKKDICVLCESKHNGHKFTTYGSIIPDVGVIKNDLRYLKDRIYELKNNIKDIIVLLNKLMDNLNNYCKIYNDMVNNFDIRKKNYSILQNINDMKNYNIDFIKKLTEIINDKNIKTKFNDIIQLGAQMEFKFKEQFQTIAENEIKDEEDDTKTGENIEENTNQENNENAEENIQRYNPSDDKYENFDIVKLKEINSFSTKYDINLLFVLHDRRILLCQRYSNENSEDLYKLCVYNLKNGIICEINSDSEEIEQIFQMDDDYVILTNRQMIKIILIKKRKIEDIQTIETRRSNLYKVSNSLILKRRRDEMEFYLYEKGKLTLDTQRKIDLKIDWGFNELCVINEKEFAVYYTREGKIYGNNAFLDFYDITRGQLIKTLKLGDGDSGSHIFLANKNNLILDRNNKLVLIDPKKKIIKKEIKYEDSFSSFLPLNEKVFLIDNYGLEQYEFENENQFKLKGKKDFDYSLFGKYPDNKIYMVYDKNISIYDIENKTGKFTLGDKCKTSVHDHEMTYMTTCSWNCDGKNLPKGCYSKDSDFNKTVPRYRCDKCDFDLCDKCIVNYII